MDQHRREVVTKLGMLGATALGLTAVSQPANAQGVADANKESQAKWEAQNC